MGLGDVVIYMSLVALYIAMGAFGGTLRADLSVALLYAAALTILVVPPVAVSAWSAPAGSALLVLAVGVCGIIPALGDRYGSVRLGIGLITVYASGYYLTRAVNVWHIVIGSFVAFAIILVVRLLAAVPGPDAPLRASIARVLADPSRSSAEAAARMWLRGPARVWTGRILAGSVRYRAATWAFQERLARVHDDRARPVAEVLARTEVVAQRLAGIVRAPRPRPDAVHEALQMVDGLDVEDPTVHPSDRAVMHQAVSGLRDVVEASTTRDGTIVAGARAIRRAAARNAIRAALSLDSAYFRNALRAMLAVAVALVLVHVVDRPAFALPLLLGAYGVLQPTFQGSVRQARSRAAGVITGAVIAMVVVAFATPLAAGILAALALVIAFAYIASSIAVFMGSLVVALTVAVAPLVHEAPITYAVGYALAVVVGAVIATTVGFLSIPLDDPRRRRRVLSRAMHATGAALDGIGHSSPAQLQARILAALREQQNTVVAASGASGRNAEARAAEALAGLNLLGLAITLGIAPRSASVDSTLALIAGHLHRDADAPLADELVPESDSILDGVDQLLQSEYGRLHAAIQTHRATETP
ncbi:hypothetical protein [Pseudonocardia broussonetiae]|uniref:FUSC family protein n=1 Tax=Pseudonocardia broussonetiae TaxID=2736640 RepID=A0A6M6JG83_9PSEU|nr:hypothetical protein [Pseudonocardia broussonetiae]QJY46060.1 hypothetical protein HOP40_09800 [Pseudonocardia broussonetiae]